MGKSKNEGTADITPPTPTTTEAPKPEAPKAPPVLVISSGMNKPKRKNVLTEPAKVSKDNFGNVIEER